MTTTVMMEAVKAGAGRETAHHAIKKHAVATVNDLRNGVIEKNDLMQRLASESEIPLDQQQLNAIMDTADQKTGLAVEQTKLFLDQIVLIKTKYPSAESYLPGSIL
jgi:adenylosuccinate lyase